MSSVFMYMIQYAPLCAFAFVQLSGIGPIYRIVKTKQTNNVSPVPFMAMIINCILWVYYAHIVDDTVMFIANISGIICGALYFGIYCVYTTEMLKKYFANRLVLSLAILFAFLNLLPWIARIPSNDFKYFIAFAGCGTAIFLMSSPLTQMKQVLAEKSTQSMSLIMSIAMTTNGVIWTLYGFAIRDGDLFIVIPNIVGAIAGFIQLSLFYVYPSDSYVSVLLDNESNSTL